MAKNISTVFRARENNMMTLIEAANAIKDYCRHGLCLDCIFMKDPGENLPYICKIRNSDPCDWVLEEEQ